MISLRQSQHFEISIDHCLLLKLTNLLTCISTKLIKMAFFQQDFVNLTKKIGILKYPMKKKTKRMLWAKVKLLAHPAFDDTHSHL